MVESSASTDFSVPQEVDKWKCYTWGWCGCGCIQNGKPLWENGVMKIYNNVAREEDDKQADVKICFDLGKEVYIDKVVFDYKICDSVYLSVGTENDYVNVNSISLGCKGWYRDVEKNIGRRGRYFCFWLNDYSWNYMYTVYIDNVRLYIKP